MPFKVILTAMLILFLLVPGRNMLLAQSYPVSNSGSTLTLSGTSNVRDWQARANRFRGSIFVQKEENRLKKVEELQFQVFSESLKSEKEKLTGNMHQLLKTGEYDFITYKLDKVENLKCNSEESCTLATSGVLIVAGVSKPIDLLLDMSLSEDQIVLTGNTSLLMTDFNIEPPSALLGLLKTDNEVNVDFKAVFRK